MKKILICIFFTFYLVACASNDENKLDTNLSIKDVPMAEELKEWKTDEIYHLKKQLEYIPLKDSEVFFSNEVSKFLSNYEMAKLRNLVITQDLLSVIQGQNRKSLFNLCFNIDVEVDWSNKASEDISEEDLAEQILDFLETFGFYKLKAKEGVVNVLNIDGSKIHNTSRDFLIMDEKMFFEQSEKEYAVQTLAYDYISDSVNLSLSKFGIIEEYNELYIEYSVNDDYFKSNDIEKDILSLKELAEKLKNHLILSQVAKDYLTENRIQRIVISFCNGILDDSCLRVSFEV